MKAMIENDYTGLYDFYYKRIEESIIELDLYKSEIDDDVKTKRLLKDINSIVKY